jgi:hypothetical protein
VNVFHVQWKRELRPATKVTEAKKLAESSKRIVEGAKKTVEPGKKTSDNGTKIDEKKTHKVRAHEPTVSLSVEPTGYLCCRGLTPKIPGPFLPISTSKMLIF